MGQPLGVAIIGGGSSDLVRKARGLGRQVWPSLKSLSTQLLEAAAARRPLRSPSLRHGRGLEADTAAILRTDLADILVEAVAAGGGEAGVDGRHKEGHKAETTAATAYPTAISASSMKPRTMADRRNR